MRPRFTRRPARIRTAVLGICLATTACAGPAATTTPSGSAAPRTSFAISSDAFLNGGTLPKDFTCDGAGVSPPLSWTQAPAGTREFALLMTTLPGDGTTKWNWVLYAVPAGVSALPRGVSGIGTSGVGSDGPVAGYQPPCSQGPGPKQYTFTIYALSATPAIAASRPGGADITAAVSAITLAQASASVTYTRP